MARIALKLVEQILEGEDPKSVFFALPRQKWVPLPVHRKFEWQFTRGEVALRGYRLEIHQMYWMGTCYGKLYAPDTNWPIGQVHWDARTKEEAFARIFDWADRKIKIHEQDRKPQQESEDPKAFLRQYARDERKRRLERNLKLRYAQKFVAGYTDVALQTSNDENEENFYDMDYEVSGKAWERMENDCLDFFEANYDDISNDLYQAGQDFWLTRNRHGSGFWDGHWPDETGKRLTANAHAYGEAILYLGDDGKVHHY